MEPIPLGKWDGKELSVTIGFIDEDWAPPNTIVQAKVTDNLADIMMTLPNEETREGGFLHTFYVNPRKADPTAKGYKGLGKAMLCAVIGKFIKLGRLQPSDEIELEASGGNSTQAQRDAVTETDEQLRAFLGKYNGLLEDMGEECSREDLVETTCNIRENQRLVDYYKQYGFKVTAGEDKGYVTGMRGKVSGILSACASKGGRKTRRRKRSRRQRKRSTR